MKKNIAIVAGGDSSEYIVSLKSAASIYTFLDSERYRATIVTLVNGVWRAQVSDTEHYLIDKNDFSYTKQGERCTFDYAYITIHGTPGENGLLQGYFEMIGLPYSCCGVLSAALTFNKFACNHYLKGFGFSVANSILLRKGDEVGNERVLGEIGLPCFIKSNVGGSSFGVTKVKTEEQIQPAIAYAFKEGNEVIIEAYLEGTEVTCGCYKTASKEVMFPITEVVSENEFFDFDAKYNGQVQEITPARVADEIRDKIQACTMRIYDILGCNGIIRIDYIITNRTHVNVLEVNTTPGMTATSFIPQQVAAAGLDMREVLTDIIENR